MLGSRRLLSIFYSLCSPWPQAFERIHIFISFLPFRIFIYNPISRGIRLSEFLFLLRLRKSKFLFQVFICILKIRALSTLSKEEFPLWWPNMKSNRKGRKLWGTYTFILFPKIFKKRTTGIFWACLTEQIMISDHSRVPKTYSPYSGLFILLELSFIFITWPIPNPGMAEPGTRAGR